MTKARLHESMQTQKFYRWKPQHGCILLNHQHQSLESLSKGFPYAATDQCCWCFSVYIFSLLYRQGCSANNKGVGTHPKNSQLKTASNSF